MDATRNPPDAAGKQRRGPFWFGAAMMVCAWLAAIGAWREIAHHGGLLLVTAPAAAIPSLAALLARHAARAKRARLS